jgi:hypothetical protein
MSEGREMVWVRGVHPHLLAEGFFGESANDPNAMYSMYKDELTDEMRARVVGDVDAREVQGLPVLR